MEYFVWNMAISFQLLFVIISGVIYIYLRKKSFKYYALYNLFLGIYIVSRDDHYFHQLEVFVNLFLSKENTVDFLYILFLFVQVVFYSFYSIFTLYFLDLDAHTKKFFKNLVLLFRVLVALFFILGIVCYFIDDQSLYFNLYTFLFLPIILSTFYPTVSRAVKYSGKHKGFFLIGLSCFVCCALIAFIGSQIPSLNNYNPISVFYIGIIIETIFFSLGLAYKIKLINDEKNRVETLVTKHKHQQQISKLKGLLEGEENERKRIAEELHDGIAGDLSAIKYNLAHLNQRNQNPENDELLDELSQIIDKSCVQLREISHNLSPTAITNYGLSLAVENYCKKIENLYHIKIDYQFSGEALRLTNTSETHIYRIIQELLNNIVKHSGAHSAQVEIKNSESEIIIKVSDNGKGFSPDKNSKGIGLSNIDSRIRFLDAQIQRESSEMGTSFIIKINSAKNPQLS